MWALKRKKLRMDKWITPSSLYREAVRGWLCADTGYNSLMQVLLAGGHKFLLLELDPDFIAGIAKQAGFEYRI